MNMYLYYQNTADLFVDLNLIYLSNLNKYYKSSGFRRHNPRRIIWSRVVVPLSKDKVLYMTRKVRCSRNIRWEHLQVACSCSDTLLLLYTVDYRCCRCCCWWHCHLWPLTLHVLGQKLPNLVLVSFSLGFLQSFKAKSNVYGFIVFVTRIKIR